MRHLSGLQQCVAVTVFRGSSTCCTRKVHKLLREILTMQMLMLAQEGGRIKGGWWVGEVNIRSKDPLLTHFSSGRWANLRESHLCSSNRPDHWDNYAINTGNEKKVGHATFHRPRHSHILTGLEVKPNTWHPFPLPTLKRYPAGSNNFLISYGRNARVTSSRSN